jgi:hypothetical protein
MWFVCVFVVCVQLKCVIGIAAAVVHSLYWHNDVCVKVKQNACVCVCLCVCEREIYEKREYCLNKKYPIMK